MDLGGHDGVYQKMDHQKHTGKNGVVINAAVPEL